MAAYSGFAESDYENVFIILDKMDKIGLEGVSEELEKEGLQEKALTRILACSVGSPLISRVCATLKKS